MQSMAVWPSLLKEVGGDYGVPKNDQHSVFTFEVLRSFQLWVSRLLKASLVYVVSSPETYSSPDSLPGLQKKVELDHAAAVQSLKP